MDKRTVRMISMIHDTTVVNTGRAPEIKKFYAVFQ
jgi:hypothetical protein